MARKFTDIILRKVGGKMKAFGVFSKLDEANATAESFITRKGRLVAKMDAQLLDKEVAETVSTHVNPELRRKGFSRQLFKTLSDKLSKSGRKYFRSGEIQSAAQVKIRSKFRTKFIQKYTGPYQEGTRFGVRAKEAAELAKSKGVIEASTELPLRFDEVARSARRRNTRRLKKGQKVIFRRVKGRLVPIKVKG